MRLRNSFWAMLGQQISDAPGVVVERVRQAMLLAVDEHCGEGWSDIDDRISYAQDITALWYLRSDLMNAVAAVRGEAVARDCISTITVLFQGHQPGGKSSRFSNLQG